MRLVFNDDGSHYPDKEIMTKAKEHDSNQLEVLVDDREAMYVFDRGYVDYKRFDSFTDDGHFFVCLRKMHSIIVEIHLPCNAFTFTRMQVFCASAACPLANKRRIYTNN